jgi:hypothetical protein
VDPKPVQENATMRPLAILSLLLVLCLAVPADAQTPLSTSFTYQGQLLLNGSVVNNPVDLQFRLYDAPTGGNVIGSLVQRSNVDVSKGVLAVDLDFGSGAFNGEKRYLEISVANPAGSTSYSTLDPRQEITAVPYALHALNGGGGGGGQWQLVGNAITNTNSGFVGINGSSPLTSAEVFGVRSPATSGYGGMYMSTAGNQGEPFYGYDAGGLRAWTYLEGSTQSWKLFNGGDRLTVTSGGNVGVGTTSPSSKLQVAGMIHSTTGGFKFPDGSIQTSAATGGGGGNDGDWQLDGNDMYNLNSGKVVVGSATGANGAKLTVTGGDYGLTLAEINGTLGGQLNLRGSSSAYYSILTANAQTKLSTGSGQLMNLSAGGVLRLDGSDGVEFFTSSGRMATMDTAGLTEFLKNNTTPTVTIEPSAGGGTQGGAISLHNDTNPTNATAVLDGEYGNGGGGALILRNAAGATSMELAADLNPGDRGMIRLYKPDGTKTVEIDTEETGDPSQGGTIKLYDDSGNPTIELDADYGTSNEGRVITQVLEITGGSDLSEQFDVLTDPADSIEPGSVVSIDPQSPGDLRLSSKSYDRCVAGVISGAGGVRPGLLMGQRGTEADGKHPVALTGRVYCKVDASFGAIAPGDLLTTSPTPGYAMKVGEHDRAQGAILGKAMSSLDDGQGMVLVLVSLQ